MKGRTGRWLSKPSVSHIRSRPIRFFTANWATARGFPLVLGATWGTPGKHLCTKLFFVFYCIIHANLFSSGYARTHILLFLFIFFWCFLGQLAAVFFHYHREADWLQSPEQSWHWLKMLSVGGWRDGRVKILSNAMRWKANNIQAGKRWVSCVTFVLTSLEPDLVCLFCLF